MTYKDLDNLRRSRKLTIETFVDAIGVSSQTYHNWKNKEQVPKQYEAIIQKLYPYGSELISMIKDPALDYNKRLDQIHPDPNGKEIPYYETEVFATISPAMGDVVALKPDTFIRIPMFSQGQFALTVTGNSMKGFINHGDWVVIRKITDREEIIFGEPHLIVTKAESNAVLVAGILKGMG